MARPAHYRNGVRSGRKPLPNRCVLDAGILGDNSGVCAGCGRGPLHANGQCVNNCSFKRTGVLLCRECTALYDLFFKGSTLVRDHGLEFTVEELQRVSALIDRARAIRARVQGKLMEAAQR